MYVDFQIIVHLTCCISFLRLASSLPVINSQVLKRYNTLTLNFSPPTSSRAKSVRNTWFTVVSRLFHGPSTRVSGSLPGNWDSRQWRVFHIPEPQGFQTVGLTHFDSL